MKTEKKTVSASRIIIAGACAVLVVMMALCAGLIVRNGQSAAALLASCAAPARTTNVKLTYASTRTVPAVEQENEPPEFAQSGPFTRAQIVEKCAPSVVGIDITYTATDPGYGWGFGGYGSYGGGTQEAKASGSGVILTNDGFIATCAHVVESANTITVTLNDETVYPATLIGSDSKNDIAIIKIEANGLVPAMIGDSDVLVVGEDVIAIGNPMGELRGTATAGIISATKRTIVVEGREMELVQTDAAVNSGNSGGGLFNARGELIGIVNAKVSSYGVEGIGFAIPVNSVTKEIGDILTYGYVTGRAYLGVYTQNVTLRSNYGYWGYSDGRRCVQIVEIIPGSAAEAAGLQTGDLILKVNDEEVTTNASLSNIIQGFNAGDKATLTIQRDGVESTVEVTFGEYKPADTVQEQ